MRSLKLMTLAGLLITMLSIAATAQTKSLYERLGGKESITAVVDDFAGRVLADTRINAKFGKSDPVRLKAQLVDQICAASGGPCQYTGRDMKTAHMNMGVTAGEFNALVEDLVATLNKFNVGETEKNELLGVLGPMKTDIVEVNNDTTGTPLPKKYKNYTAGKGGKSKNKAAKVKKSKEEKAAPAEAPAANESGEQMMKSSKKSKKKDKN